MAFYECNIGFILESPKLISKAIQPFVNAPRDTKVSALINITSDMIDKKCIFLVHTSNPYGGLAPSTLILSGLGNYTILQAVDERSFTGLYYSDNLINGGIIGISDIGGYYGASCFLFKLI